MVESIKELRIICQKKQQLYNQKGEKNTAKKTEEYFYDQFLRLVSIYLTKMFLYTPITSNQVSLISMGIGIFAGLFFSFAHPIYWIIGFLLLQLFHFLDAVDGEIARYRKEATPIGKYFDIMAAAVTITAFFTGITLGIYNTFEQPVILLIGFVCVLAHLLGAVSGNLQKQLIYKYIIEEERKGNKRRDLVPEIDLEKAEKINVHAPKYLLRKLFGFDGLAFFILAATILDLIFKPGIFSLGNYSIILNWRYSFLIIFAIAGTLILIKKINTASKLKKKFLN